MSKQSFVGNWTLQHLDTFGFGMITTLTYMVKAAPILASVHLILRYQKVFVRLDLRSEPSVYTTQILETFMSTYT